MAVRKTPYQASRILVADKNPRVRKLYARRLRTAGYSVSEAKSGREALELLRDMRFRLLVLDLDMPDSNGFGVLKTLRADFPHIQVLAVTGYMRGALAEAAECFGARRALKKPATPQVLVNTARQLLGDLD